MFLTSDEIPTEMCKTINYLNSKLFLYVLCYVSSKQDFEYIKAQNEFTALATKEILPGSYLKFNDGYVYSKNFNIPQISMQIEDTSLDIKFITEDIINQSNVSILNIEIFRNFVIKILEIQLKEYSKDMEDMFTNEYIEMAFIKSFKKVLETSNLIDSMYNNN